MNESTLRTALLLYFEGQLSDETTDVRTADSAREDFDDSGTRQHHVSPSYSLVAYTVDYVRSGGAPLTENVPGSGLPTRLEALEQRPYLRVGDLSLKNQAHCVYPDSRRYDSEQDQRQRQDKKQEYDVGSERYTVGVVSIASDFALRELGTRDGYPTHIDLVRSDDAETGLLNADDVYDPRECEGEIGRYAVQSRISDAVLWRRESYEDSPPVHRDEGLSAPPRGELAATDVNGVSQRAVKRWLLDMRAVVQRQYEFGCGCKSTVVVV
ncbi:hypothetical protein [Halovenus sp. HT40]|uniref:hypothetical protein n=1 Tax=Halovenus sp. HT40 TaxID=3126691 RepID=UPI00300E92AD